MAEGDTVHATAARLHRSMAGRSLTSTDFRVARFATIDLSGDRVREVVARGKHLLMRTEGGVSVHSHLGMDGAWHVYEAGSRWRGPHHEIRCVLEAEDRTAVGHRLRRLEVLSTSREGEALGHLGPDVLGPNWDPLEAIRRLVATPEREVGVALIDQQVMAGPGNVYRSEVCFLAGVDPRTRVGAVAEPAILVELMKAAMERNRAGGRRVTTDDPRPGQELWVYGRRGRPCRRCGTAIRSISQGAGSQERIVYLCPSCQPAVTANDTLRT